MGDQAGDTELMVAAACGELDAMKMLLDKGADMEHVNKAQIPSLCSADCD